MSAKSAIVVSGGSGSIGGAVCMQLASAGYLPIVGYHSNVASAQAVAERCTGVAMPLDLASAESIDNALDEMRRLQMPITGAVLAGAPALSLQPFGRIEESDLWRQWQIHVQGPQRLLSALVKRFFRTQRRGTVIGVLSRAMGNMSGTRATAGMGGYVIGKYGLAGVLAALAAEYPWLHVSTVSPGYTETKMLEAFDERFLSQQRARAPFQSPEGVARQIVEEALTS